MCDYEDCKEPPLRDSEYCIFHEPDKTGLAAMGFYKLIRQEAREPEGETVEDEEGEKHRRWVFDEKITWQGYCSPPKKNQA